MHQVRLVRAVVYVENVECLGTLLHVALVSAIHAQRRRLFIRLKVANKIPTALRNETNIFGSDTTFNRAELKQRFFKISFEIGLNDGQACVETVHAKGRTTILDL